MRMLLFVSSRCSHCPGAEAVAKKVAPEYQAYGMEMKKIRMKTSEGKRLAGQFNVMSMPTTLLLDNDNNEIHRFVGVPNEGNLRGKIESSLGIKKSFFSRILKR